MSKEEFLKIQTCVLKVNIHCEGCKNKVKKILQRIEGVYTIKIDPESSKVTISGNVDSATLIKKLIKKGKHAELWGSPKPSNNHPNQQLMTNQLKNLKIENGKGGSGNKGQGEKGTNNNNNQMHVKGGNPGMPTPQQLQQLKAFQDMKMLPQFKAPMNAGGNNPKAVKFDLPDEDEDDFTDDEFDDEFDDELDDFSDDEMDLMPPNKMKPVMDKGSGAQMPNAMHLMNGHKGGGIMPQMNNGGGNKGQVGGPPNNKSSKNSVGHPQQVKNFDSPNKNNIGSHGGAGPNFNGNKVGGMNNGLPNMPNMMTTKASFPNMGPLGQMGNNIGQMSNHSMGQIPAVQGLPAPTPGMSFAGNNGGYPGNSYNQQQMMMNGNERFQPMMYAPQPPAVNYVPPPYPYYYPYPPPPTDNYGSMHNDEDPSACIVM